MSNKNLKSSSFAGQKRYILIFIIGVLVFIYPTLSNTYYSHIITKSSIISINNAKINSKTSISDKASENKSNRIQISDEEFKKIQSDPIMGLLPNKSEEYIKEYNNRLWNISEYTKDPFSDKETCSVDDSKKSDDKDSIFAYIKIDKIHQTLPIYLGATDDHLNKGVAVIQGTSIPVGGENTNSVIAGHTGQVQKFFTDLPDLESGDIIQITNHWRTLYYKVTGNKIILPNQQEYLNIVKGFDMITLLTCYSITPKNDRLLVFAKRYYPHEESKEDKVDSNSYPYLSQIELKPNPWYEKPQNLVIGIATIFVFLFVYTFFKKQKSNK